MVMRKLLFTLSLLVTMALSPAQAQEGQDQPARDVRVVVDISGSMKVNDPDNLRRPAVRLIARLLPDDTGVGLWTFGSMVNMLVPHEALDDDLRTALVEGSESINSVAQRTNIGSAIEEAASDWFAPDRSLANTHLILLSDGKVDISANQASNDQERDRILDELVPSLADKGLTIHTIALSGEADLDLLGAIADMTGGIARVAESAEELSRIFADTIGQAVPANEVPLENNRFAVDSGVEEFTALIFSETSPDQRELGLISPDGQRYSASSNAEQVRWAREAGYDLITIDQPAAGEWQLEGTLGQGSRVTVVSDLRLEVEPMPARFQLGDEVDLKAFFTEEGERITDPDFLGVITVSLSMTTEDGRRGTRILSENQPPADGIYQDTIANLPEPGQYLLELEADGGTFSRKFRKTLVLEAPEGEAVATSGEGVPLAPETSEEPREESEPEPEPPAGPVDLSQLEEPEPEMAPATEPEPEAETPPEVEQSGPSLLAWWPWAAGVLAVVVLGAVAFVLLKSRRSQQDETGEAGDDAPAESPDQTKPAAVATPKEEKAEEEETPDDMASPEMEDDSIMEPEEAPRDMESDDDDMAEPPVAGDMTEPDEKPADADDEPSPRETPAETEPEEPGTDSGETEETLPGDDDDDEEFGLEDFDLADIDDLPDLDNDEEDGERDKSSPDDKKKKE